MMMTQVPVEITVNGSRLDRRCGTREAFESCAPQMMRTSGDKASRRGDLGLERSERVPGLAHRREEPPPAERVDHARELALVRAPEVRVRADRGHFRRHRPAEAPDQILRIGQERARLLELSRVAALEIEDVPPEIEAPRQMRRPRLLKGRTRRVVVGVDIGESIELVVQRRQRRAIAPHEDAGAAMRRDRDRLDGKTRAELLERADEESPGAFRVEPEIRPFRRQARAARSAPSARRERAPPRSKTTSLMFVLPTSKTATQRFMRSVQMERVGERRRALRWSRHRDGAPKRRGDPGVAGALRSRSLPPGLTGVAMTIANSPSAQKSNLVTLSLLKMKGAPSRISLPLTTLSLPSLPASTEVAPGFSLPSATARMT